MTTVRQDLLQILAKEHREHRDALHDMMATGVTVPERSRRRAFGMLTLRISTQLAAEDVLVHPLAERLLADGPAFVEERRAEMDLVMSGLANAGDRLDDGFPDALAAAAHGFVSYTDHQEVVGFLAVRQRTSPPWLRRLGRIHEHLRRLLPGRYLRETGPDLPPWADPRLLATCRDWYQLEATRDGLDADGLDATLLEQVETNGAPRPASSAIRWTHR